jgi:anaerobic selenocysteine-containing dehydrogenase
MFEHFPRDFFKYIAMTAAVSIVLAFLVWLLRSAGRPNPATQLKRHREAYAGQRCPNCAFPIGGVARLRGRKARRAPAIGVPFAPAEASEESKTRHCPSCGVSLFEKCEACGATRHSLLPFCERCGDGRDRRAVAV